MPSPLLWIGVLRRLAADLGPSVMEAWVHPLVAEADGGGLRLRCPSPFHRDRIRDRLLERIARCAEAEAGRPVPVALGLGGRPGEAGEPPRHPAARAPLPAGQGEPAQRKPAEPAESGRAEPAENRRAESRPGEEQRGSAPQPLQYTFDGFVVGPCNALAREACMAIATGHQAGLSSVYLAGAPGLGKTHLARAVVAAAAQGGASRALYASAERFTSEFQSALRSGRMDAFKRRYRQGCDLLVVEDVQFLPGKKATQLEIFHTIEYLRDAGARMIFTGDRLPGELVDLDPRLCSRWNGGLVAQLEPPDASVRRAILHSRAARGGVRLPDDCLDLLVETLRGSVRDLEGVLIQLVASASLLKRGIDRELTQAALRKVLPRSGSGPRPQPEVVIEVVAGFFQTTPAALACRSRRRDVLLPRQLAMYLCRRYTDASLGRIGRAFGREHPAVAHAVSVVERRILERAPLRYQVEALCARIEERCGLRSLIIPGVTR